MYTGALENRPELVRQMMLVRTLWGNDDRVLRRVRRPWEIAECLKTAGLPCPLLLRSFKCGPMRGKWLVKPLAGGGGRGIHFWSKQATGFPDANNYLQEYVQGQPCAAVYTGHGRRALLLGVTRQLVGEPWLHAAPFCYCGSIGPLALSAATEAAFLRLGEVLVQGFGLRGLFGVDCVLRNDLPYPVEINPRYTASVEVLEHATGVAALCLHRQAFVNEPVIEPPLRSSKAIGKAFLFARQRLVLPSSGPWTAAGAQLRGELPQFADIPRPGEIIGAGQPIFTIFASAESVDCCLDNLREQVRTLEKHLFGL
jgi:uncharacterized protein